MTLSFWQYKVYADIRGSSADIRGNSLEKGVKRQFGCRKRQFSVLSLAISSEALEVTPTLLRII